MVIKNLSWSLLVVSLALSAGANAQSGFEGLDLSDEPKKEDPKKKDDKKKPEPKKDDDGGLDLNSDTPKSAATSSDAKKDTRSDARKPLAKQESSVGERDTTQDDRVKSVQRKLYIKRNRFELAPYFTYNINDPYYTRFGAAVRAAFYPADTLAVSVRFNLLQTLPTDDVRIAKRNLQSRIFFSVPLWSVMGNVEWSLLYGKAAFMNSILHLDGYLVGGAGVVYCAATEGKTINPGFDLGLGLRFVAKDWIAANVALINTTYVDIPTGTTKASTQNNMMLYAGVSIFFPFKSTYREAE